MSGGRQQVQSAALLSNSFGDGRIFARRVGDLWSSAAEESWQDRERRQRRERELATQDGTVCSVPLALPARRQPRRRERLPKAETPPRELPPPAADPACSAAPARKGFCFRSILPPREELKSPAFLLAYQKAAPCRESELIGCRKGKDALANYLERPFTPGKLRDVAALLLGPPGSGKTLTSRLALRERNFAVVEVGSLDFGAALTFAVRNTPARTVTGARTAIFIEDLDAVAEKDPSVLDLVVSAPLVATAAFLSNKLLGRFANSIYFYAFSSADSERILARAIDVLRLPRLSAEARADVVAESQGDARQIVLQGALFGADGGSRDNTPSPFQLFRDLAQGRGNPELATSYLTLLLFENAPRALALEDLAVFSERLAFSDALGSDEVEAEYLAAEFRALPKSWAPGTQVHDARAHRRSGAFKRSALPWKQPGGLCCR